MGRNWIIDVLADLRSFAEMNDLPMLAEELARTARVAQRELAMVPEGMPIPRDGHANRILSGTGRTGTGA